MIMTAAPSARFSKMNWLKFHQNRYSTLAKNTFDIILIGELIVVGLSWCQNVWDKFLKPLKSLNCDVEGDRIQNVLWRALNLPVFSNLKNVVALCGTNNVLLDPSRNIVDGILEIARSFKTSYSCVNVVICRILPRDDSCSVNRVFIKEVNQILKLKCYESSYTSFVYGSGWTLSNCSLNADL